MKWKKGNKSKLELKILPKESESQQGTTKKMLATLQQAKRFLRILFGFTLLAIGAVMILTPGPGWLTIMLGLGVLAAEYVWARRLLDKMKEQGLRLRDVFLPRPRQTTGPA
jgi:uncharacterized protein (TIGR02611 family)